MKLFMSVLLLMLSSTAFASECLWVNSISDWRAIDATHLQLQVGRKVYDMQTYSCTQMLWADRIAFRTFPRGSARVCKGDDLLVLENFGRRIRQVCPIRDIQRLNN